MGLKDSQLTTTIATMKGSEYWGVSYYNGSSWVTAKLPLSIFISYIETALTQSYTETDLAANTTTPINLGASATYGAFEVIYYANRNGKRVKGTINVIHDGSSVVVSDTNKIFTGASLGLSIKTGQISSGQVQVNLITDSSDANQTAFNYRISESIIL